MNKRISKKSAIFLAVCLLTGLACDLMSDAPDNLSKKSSEISSIAGEVILIIDYSSTSDTLQMDMTDRDSLTVLNVLQTSTTVADIHLELKEYPFGVLVEQIRERINGAGGYWLYTVNGKTIPHAASAFYVHPTDTIKFFFK